jgi:Zn finger protein HypA/HybF involved in hydrogenase expression
MSSVKREKFKVICLECEKRFKTSSYLPECPNCHGSDIDLDYENENNKKEEV